MLEAHVVSSMKDFDDSGLKRFNLLIDQCLADEEPNNFTAKLLTPAGTATGAALNDFPHWADENELMDVKILWDGSTAAPMLDGKMWILGCFSFVRTDGFRVFVINEDTVIYPIPTIPMKPLHVLECFGGGYGGWHFAFDHLASSHQLDKQVVVVESCAASCCAFSMTHQIPIYNGFVGLPTTFLDVVHGDCILHADMRDATWKGAVARWHPPHGGF